MLLIILSTPVEKYLEISRKSRQINDSYPQKAVHNFLNRHSFPQNHRDVEDLHTALCNVWAKIFTACGKLPRAMIKYRLSCV